MEIVKKFGKILKRIPSLPKRAVFGFKKFYSKHPTIVLAIFVLMILCVSLIAFNYLEKRKIEARAQAQVRAQEVFQGMNKAEIERHIFNEMRPAKVEITKDDDWKLTGMNFESLLKEKANDDEPWSYIENNKKLIFAHKEMGWSNGEIIKTGTNNSVGEIEQLSVNYPNTLGKGINTKIIQDNYKWQKIIEIESLESLGEIPEGVEYLEISFDLGGDFDFPEGEITESIIFGENSFIQPVRAWDSAETNDEIAGDENLDSAKEESKAFGVIAGRIITKKIPVEWLKQATFPVLTDTTITYGAENAFNEAVTSKISISALDATHFVVAYMDDGGDSYGIARVGVISGTTISSYGAENVFNSAITHYISVAALDSTHFVLVYHDDDGDTYGHARVGVISGTTISSYGAENTFNSANTSFNVVAALDSTHFVVAYRDEGGVDYGIARIGATDGGTTISSYGAENVFNSASTFSISVSILDSTHFVVAYRDAGGDTYGHARVGVISGTTISSYGAENTFNSVLTTYISVTRLDSTHFVVSYKDDGGDDYGAARVGVTSGTTISSYGTENVFNSAVTNYNSVAAFGSARFVVAYQDAGNSSYGTGIVGLRPGRFWVGGTGNWSDTAHWSASPGGAGGASVPTSSDDVYFDANSFSAGSQTVTIDATANCADMNWTGVTDTPTLAGSSALNIYGSLILDAGMTRTYTGAITFAATSTGKTITSNGIALASTVTFDGVGGGWILQDAFNNGNKTLSLRQGNLNTNGVTVTSGLWNQPSSDARTLTLGASTINCTAWSVGTAGLTLNAGTSIIKVTGTGNFGGVSHTYYEVQLNGTSHSVSGANTFTTLTRTGTTSKTNTLTLSRNQTITGTLTINGNLATNRVLVKSNILGTTRTLTAANVVVTNADFQDITGAGASGWDLSAITGGSGDCGGNSGITFTTAQTNYWVGNAGSWSTVGEWASTSGGAGSSGRVPLPQDTARFDANSFSTTALTVTQDMPRIGSVDWTGATNTPTWTTSTTASVFGSMTLISGMTLTASTQTYTFEGRGSYTLDCGGQTLPKNITLSAPSGTLTLKSDFISNKTLSVTDGTFSAVDGGDNYNVTCNDFYSRYSTTRTITMGSGVWTITSDSAIPWRTDGTGGLTLNEGTSTIKLTGVLGVNLTFYGGDETFYNFWNATIGAYSVRIYNSNTFNDFKIDAGRTTQFTAGTTQTVSSFTATGSLGNLITLESSSTSPFTLTKATGGTVSSDYLSVSYSTATPGTTWYAGTNSTDGGNNTGWTFTYPPGRYWIGGTGNWSDTAHWSASPGGSGGASVPTSSDDVYFDANSFSAGSQTVTIDATANCADMNWTGVTDTPTLAGSSALNIYGSLILDAGMTRTYTGAITFAATTTGKTLTFNGITMANHITFDGVGGEWTLQDNLNATGKYVTLITGTLDTNGKRIDCKKFDADGSFARTLTLGASIIDIDNVGIWDLNPATNLTFNVGTSTISGGGTIDFYGGGLTYNIVSMSAAGEKRFRDGSTFSTFTIDNGTYGGLTLYSDQIITGTLTIDGYNLTTSRVLVKSDTLGTARTITAANVSVTNADFQDITGAGAGSWDLSAITGKSGDCGGNTGITFTTAQTNYWVGDTGSWSTVAEWASTSGGAGSSGRVPLPQDTARFDANSFSTTSLTVTQDMPRIGSVDWTGATNTPTWTTSTAASVFGSMTLISGMTLTASTNGYTFAGRGSHTLDSGGKTWEKSITLNAPGGTLTLASDLTMGATRTLGIATGILTTVNGGNNYILNIGRLYTTSSGASLTLGSATHLLTGVTGTFWITTAGTVNFDASTIKLTGALTGELSFSPGTGRTLNNFWNATSGDYAVKIVGSNTFNDFKIDAGRTVQFTAGTTQTVNSFTATGSVGNLITLESSSTSPFTLTKSGGGTISCDYLSVSYSTATPGTTWYAGTNSTDGGNNTGWVFTIPPVIPTVTTQAVSSVESTTATGNGTITATGGENPGTRGFCYMTGTEGDPTTANSTTYDTGSFIAEAYTKGLTGLSSSTNYRVRAYAINSAGTGYGTTVQILTKPLAPTWQTPNHSAIAVDSITWQWNSSTGATGYKLCDGTGINCSDLGNVTSYQESTLSANTQYTRTIRAYNATGDSSASTTGSAYTAANAPSAPSLSGITVNSVNVDNQINSNPASTEFILYVEAGGTCDGSGGWYFTASGSPSSVAIWQTDTQWGTITVSELDENTQYAFCSKARNGDSIETAWSATAATTTTDAIPSISSATAQPNPQTVEGKTTFVVEWTAQSSSGETVKVHICKTNTLVSYACDTGQAWCESGSFTDSNPQTCEYTTASGDVASSPNTFYAFICDNENKCTSGTSGTFSVNNISIRLDGSIRLEGGIKLK